MSYYCLSCGRDFQRPGLVLDPRGEHFGLICGEMAPACPWCGGAFSNYASDQIAVTYDEGRSVI